MSYPFYLEPIEDSSDFFNSMKFPDETTTSTGKNISLETRPQVAQREDRSHNKHFLDQIIDKENESTEKVISKKKKRKTKRNYYEY